MLQGNKRYFRVRRGVRLAKLSSGASLRELSRSFVSDSSQLNFFRIVKFLAEANLRSSTVSLELFRGGMDFSTVVILLGWFVQARPEMRADR